MTVVCLGDSNTEGDLFFPAAEGWCGLLAADPPQPNWRFVNRGRKGVPACAHQWPARFEQVPSADDLLTESLAQDAPDVVILSFGTNDVLLDCDLDAVLAGYRGLVARVRAAGAHPLIASTPPFAPPVPQAEEWNRRVAAINRALRRIVPATDLVDFATTDPGDGLADGIHLGPAGQRRRAAAARAVLLRPRLQL